MRAYRVLIVDDDAASHEVLGEYLKAAGYDVLGATNGLEGLAAAKQHQPDLILLDVQMPLMDGFQTLEALKASRAAEAPVLFLTQLDRSYLKVKGLELGADDYVTKPFEKAELLARIKVALRRTARYRNASAAMEGRLSEVGLADVLQTLEIAGKTARVRLADVDGELTLRAGVLLRARQGRFEGLEALKRIVLLERGSFEVVLEAPTDVVQPLGPLVNLLMSSVAYVDEVRAALARLGPAGARLGRAGSLAAFPGLAAVEARLPLSADELVAALGQDLKSNASELARALEQGALVAR